MLATLVYYYCEIVGNKICRQEFPRIRSSRQRETLGPAWDWPSRKMRKKIGVRLSFSRRESAVTRFQPISSERRIEDQTLGGFFRVLLTKGIVVEKGKNVKSLFFAFIGKGEIWLVLIVDYSRASIFVETKRIESSIGAKIKRSKGRTR